MKIFKNIFKFFFFVFFVLATMVFVLIYTLKDDISDSYKIGISDTFSVNSPVPIKAVFNTKDKGNSNNKKAGETYKVDLKMFGVIPFSSTTVQVVDKMHVAVLGNPFGMKLYTDGVLVIELSKVETEEGEKSPAEKAGLKVGDYIKSVNGKTINTNEDLSNLVASSKGKAMKFRILRNEKEKEISVTPVADKKTGGFKAGIWVRDSSAGIGTLTFYSPADGIVCGLGHGICDNDTGDILKIDSGEMLEAEIISYQKGEKGEPGELKGKFVYKQISDNLINKQNGVYGNLCCDLEVSTLTPVAYKQDVTEGEAQILCTVSGEKPKLYSCRIKINEIDSKTQNLTVTVTDKSLLNQTGGIIQGMSGSPLIQNGKLIGAITHVLVDDPTTGYAIFAENMLETAQSVANKGEIKDAS